MTHFPKSHSKDLRFVEVEYDPAPFTACYLEVSDPDGTWKLRAQSPEEAKAWVDTCTGFRTFYHETLPPDLLKAGSDARVSVAAHTEAVLAMSGLHEEKVRAQEEAAIIRVQKEELTRIHEEAVEALRERERGEKNREAAALAQREAEHTELLATHEESLVRARLEHEEAMDAHAAERRAELAAKDEEAAALAAELALRTSELGGLESSLVQARLEKANSSRAHREELEQNEVGTNRW